MSSNLVLYFGTFAVILIQTIAHEICSNTTLDRPKTECFHCTTGYMLSCTRNLAKCEECIDKGYQQTCATFGVSRCCLKCIIKEENCTIQQDAVCEDVRELADSGFQGTFGALISIILGITSFICAVVIFWKLRNNKKNRGVSDENSDDSDVHLENLGSYSNDGYQNTEDRLIHQNVSNEITKPDSKIESDGNESKNTSEDQTLSLRQLEKGSSEVQVDWTKVFLQLSNSFPPTRWELFALNLLGNCQNMQRNIQDTVSEIKLETRTEYTEGWVIHAYFKVFKKWFDNLTRTNVTFEQIEEALSVTVDAKEHMDLVLFLKKNPPMKAISPVLRNLSSHTGEHRIMVSQLSNSTPCLAFNDDNVPGTCSNTREIRVRSSQHHCYRSTHSPNCSSYSLNEISDCQERLTSIQYNKTCFEANNILDIKDNTKHDNIKKRRKSQSTTQLYKRVMTGKYAIENAKQNLLLDIIPIRQNDYDLFMEFIIELISKECHVKKTIVIAITYEGFCAACQVDSKESNPLFVIRGSGANLCVSKDVFDELAVYGNNVRSKLLTHLNTKNNDNVSEEFLFLTFQGKAVKNKDLDDRGVRKSASQKMHSEQHFHDRNPIPTKKSRNTFDNNTRTKHNSPEQTKHNQPSKEDTGTNSETHLEDLTTNEVEEANFKSTTNDDETAKSAESEKMMVNNNKPENENKETRNWDVDIEIEKEELENIKEAFFPTGEETYNIENTDSTSISEILQIFLD